MREADDATVEQARRLCDRAAHAVQEANLTLQFAKMRVARWRLESDRLAAMKSELATLSARLRALQDAAHEESERRTAFRIDMSSSARSCRLMRRSTRASRERLVATAESLKRIHQNRT